MTITIASVQLNSQDHAPTNLDIIKTAVKTAKDKGADFVVLPENACYMGKQGDIADDFDELSDRLAHLAQTYNVHLLAGTLPCPYRTSGDKIDNKFRQTSLLFDNQGQTLARYDKIHLFCATVGDGVGSYDENKTFEAGTRPVVAPCVINGQTINVGLMICFDLRFPKLAQTLRQMGADLLVAPSAFTHATGQTYWELLIKARAIDSQCMTVGSAQGGTHKTKNSERQTWGHSLIADCTGALVASTEQTVAKDGFLIALARFDKNVQDTVRQNLPLFTAHRLA